MTWLLIDTSCPRAIVGLCIDGEVVSTRYLGETKKHSEMLAPAVDEVLKEAKRSMQELQGVAVGKGPGSFIGSRIALAFAKGVCVALDIPLVGVGTLAALAHDPQLPKGRGVAVIDARRGEYYVQTFLRSIDKTQALDEPHLVEAPQIEELAQNSDFIIGTSLSHLAGEHVIGVEGVSALGLCAAFCALPNRVDEKESLVPEYVRDPDAKPMDANKKGPLDV